MKKLIRTDALKEPSREFVQIAMAQWQCGDKGAFERLKADAAQCEYWVNDLYQVEVRRNEAQRSAHINIRRRDGSALLRDWRHFQQIKNEIVGPECEAVELYPAESRLVDTSNKFHLWACLDPSFRFPFGFTERDVAPSHKSKTAGLRQR